MQPREWLATVTGDGYNEIARRAQIAQRTFYNQVDKALTAENVIKIAEAYGVHPLRALVDCELVSSAWLQVPDVEGALRLATEEQLAGEVLRRLLAAKRAGLPEPAEFTAPVDDLAARRRTERPMPDGMAARDVGAPSDRELFDAAQDAAAEAPDPDGPEDGA